MQCLKKTLVGISWILYVGLGPLHSHVEVMDMPATIPRRSVISEPSSSTVFTRHNLSLHALLLENQPWFCARDIGRLMGVHLSDRMVHKLDKDQHRVLWIEYYQHPKSS
jgi:hypothetical protein